MKNDSSVCLCILYYKRRNGNTEKEKNNAK